MRILLLSMSMICCTAFLEANAQAPAVGSWYIYNGFFNLNPKVELFFESQARLYEPISNIQVFFFRPYFNYNVTSNFQLGLGLEYHDSWTYDEVPENKIKSNEFRVTLQSMLFQNIGFVSVQHRYRYEFRTINSEAAQRMRYRLQLTIPFKGKPIEKGDWFATAGNEIMVNTQPNLNLSQNRTYGLIGYQITKGLNFQTGYMRLFFPAKEGENRLQFFLTQKLFFYER
jgi:hypothetical protein